MRVAGTIAGPDVVVLQDAVARQGLPHRIELSEVDFVDPEGASALLSLEAQGVMPVGAVPSLSFFCVPAEVRLRNEKSKTQD
jgi:hypothetical protein